jgi:hypothetical protein
MGVATLSALCRRASLSRFTIMARSSWKNTPAIWRMAVRIGSAGSSLWTSPDSTSRIARKVERPGDAVLVE